MPDRFGSPVSPGVGLQVDFETPKELQEARRRSQVAEDRGERLKALEEPAIGLRFMANPQALGKKCTESSEEFGCGFTICQF